MDNRAKFRISGGDLLNQNNGLLISSSTSSIYSTRSATLGRQPLILISYQLGSNLSPAGGGRRRG